ncbi:MAG: benzoyl-CoA reductase, bzd-type, subunit O [Dehalococcoidia bacterium]
MATTKYKTRPIESWKRAKELRLEHYKDVATAKEQGKLLVTGGTEGFVTLASGLGDYVYFGGEPYGASIAHDPPFAQECAEAAEAKGFARDMCAYMRNYWGSMFLDRFYFGGPFPRPDFSIQLHLCDSHAKWFQIVSEHFGMPLFGIEAPARGFTFDPGSDERRLEYLVGQLHDCIEWMEKTTGRKYDDEKLIHAIRNEFRSNQLWSQICTLNKNIPAPLDQKSNFALYVVSVLIRHKDESVKFYEMLLDEVKDRVANQIAAVGNEQARVLDDSQPPWYFLQLFRYLEAYGVVDVGSHYSFLLAGAFDLQEDGTWVPSKTPEERGMPLKTRDDALRALALWNLERPIFDGLLMPITRCQHIVALARDWKTDGVILHLNRGCEGLSQSIMEARLALLEAGIPVCTYEGNTADKREFDESQVIDRLESFMESLGLSKLTPV